jgi:predicted nucleic acid-binding protein
MTKRVYVDSGVLITALKVDDEALALKALEEISRSDVEYLFGPMVELEVLPKPIKHYPKQAEFFREWFSKASCVWYSEDIHAEAIDKVANYPISCMDATHIATAIIAGADEVITSEQPTKPMFMQKDVAVRSLYDSEDAASQ